MADFELVRKQIMLEVGRVGRLAVEARPVGAEVVEVRALVLAGVDGVRRHDAGEAAAGAQGVVVAAAEGVLARALEAPQRVPGVVPRCRPRWWLQGESFLPTSPPVRIEARRY